MDTNSKNDHDLLARLSDCDAMAFTEIFNTHWQKVYSTALILLKSPFHAEDIAQETFVRLWKARKRASEIRNLENFLFIIVRNLIYNRLKKTKWEDAHRKNMVYRLRMQSNDQVAILAEFNDFKSIIDEGIKLLPPQQQKAFRMSRYLGFTHQRIAKEMNISRESVKDYLVRALAFLRKHVGERTALLYFISFLVSRSQ